jgi:diguanylate cyclase (GGDEF)-like protein/PAS domain S-box-containing protein
MASRGCVMETVNNYQIEEKLYEGNHSIVYRGWQNVNNLTERVVLKILKKEYPLPEDVAKFRREFEITRDLGNAVPGVINVYGIEKHKNSFMMILEDFGGESVARLKQRNLLKLDPTAFLHLAIGITEILSDIHRQNVIHKDINPANIIWNPETDQLKIIDFGIASVLPGETVELASPNALRGTLGYISPEQTGRMNRSLDYRTDFYSLGITFYELLTTRLPFETGDPVELVHWHIARTPEAPHQYQPEIPKVISDIIMKLMAKNAEDRYQGALGLKSDLKKCLEQLTTIGKCEEFAIGREDFSDKFQIPQILYGRDKETETLLGAFAQSSEGRTEMMLVAGYAGIGKTALVQEIFKPAVQKRGYFISGKFHQFKQNIPYDSLVQAFQELVRQLLTESDEQIAQWKENILNAVGANAQVIVDLIPEVEWIIGKQEPVPELPPTQSQNRFNRVFQNFLRVFASPDHPLTIFLDDLQWIDLSSLKLIELFMSEAEKECLFLIGAYRDNEVEASHPLLRTINTLIQEGKNVRILTLGPLCLTAVNQLIADALHCRPEMATPLSELCREKSGGNPLFLRQFLHTLYQQELIRFDNNTIKWCWDIEKIKEAGITDNVVDLMVGKIRTLPERTQNALKFAAAVGACFTLKILSLVTGRAPEQTADDLWEALQGNFIFPVNEKYKYTQISFQAGFTSITGLAEYKFTHDKVQQAAYSLIDKKERAGIHLKIGRLILENTPKEKQDERIFDIVNHLNAGMELVTQQADITGIDMVKLNLLAARKAKSSVAYQNALEYAKAGMQLLQELPLPGDIWQCQYGLTYQLYKERAEIEYLNGNFDPAQSMLMFILDKARRNLEKAEIYGLLIVMATLQARYQQAIDIGRNALHLFGIHLPYEHLIDEILNANRKLQRKLHGKDMMLLLEEPEMKNLEKRAALKVLCALGPLCYLTNYEMMALVAMEMVNLALDYGQAPELGYAYATYGMVIVTYIGDYQLAFQLGKAAIAISERFHDLAMKSQACLIFNASINHWVKPIKEGNAINEEGFCVGLDSGELQYTGYILIYKTLHAFYQGKNIQDILGNIPGDLSFCEKTKNQWSIDAIYGCLLTLNNLQGKTVNLLSFDGKDITEIQYIKNCQSHHSFYALSCYMVLKAQILYLYGYVEEAHLCVSRANELSVYITTCILETDLNFYHSLIILSRYPYMGEEQEKECWGHISTNQRQMKTWADNCKGNFLHKYLLVKAEMARVTGKRLEAMNFYDQAIESARESGFIQNEALANELAAKFYLNLGLKKIARLYMNDALYDYKMWGAKRKVQDLEARYPRLFSSVFAEKELYVEEKSKIEAGAELFDLMTFIKASAALSSEIVLEKLLKKMMRFVIENAGAEKGVFLLAEDEKGTLAIEAMAAVDEKDVAVMQSIPIEDLGAKGLPLMLSQAIVNYVARTKKDVILHDAAREGQFIHDGYVKAQKPKSVICMPLMYQCRLIGILYLENNLICGTFTEERVQILDLLSSQIAISIVNARTHDRLEELVEKRTAELIITNKTLRNEIAELRQGEKELLKRERRYRKISELASDYIYEISVNSKGQMVVEWISKGFTQLTGHTVNDVKHPDMWKNVIHRRDLPGLMHMFKTILSGQARGHEMRVIKPSGDLIWIHISGHPEWDDHQHNIIGIIGAVRDISARKRLEEQLQTAALIDELTGLYNRRGFFTLAEQQCKLTDRTKRGMSLLHLGLDNIKQINDRLGHKQGDEALIDTAKILKNAFRKSDIIGRIGGDQFAVLLTEHSDFNIERIITANVRNKFRIHNQQGGRGYRLSLSIGMAQYNPMQPSSIRDLLVRADAAIYKDKKGNKYKQALMPVSIEEEKEFKKRRHKRYQVNNYWLKLDDLKKFKIKNISVGGLCLKTPQKLPTNNIYDIEIAPSIKGGTTFKGSVVWSVLVGGETRKMDKPQYEVGIEFIELEDSQKNPLKKFVRKLNH